MPQSVSFLQHLLTLLQKSLWCLFEISENVASCVVLNFISSINFDSRFITPAFSQNLSSFLDENVFSQGTFVVSLFATVGTARKILLVLRWEWKDKTQWNENHCDRLWSENLWSNSRISKHNLDTFSNINYVKQRKQNKERKEKQVRFKFIIINILVSCPDQNA